jgi:hypothetical protein
MICTWHDGGTVELYFYGELDAAARARFEAHLPGCKTCRIALEDLSAIREALAARRRDARPPGGDWDPFMTRLVARLDAESAGRRPWSWRSGVLLKIAATVAVAAAGVLGGFQLQRWRAEHVAPVTTTASEAPVMRTPSDALAVAADQHLERSKLVLLGLAAKDPREARPRDWQYERQLASTLLADTMQFRLSAAEQGRADLADVLGDLETVLLQASLGDHSDPRALARLQRLIDRRDLLTKIEVMNAEGRGRDHE